MLGRQLKDSSQLQYQGSFLKKVLYLRDAGFVTSMCEIVQGHDADACVRRSREDADMWPSLPASQPQLVQRLDVRDDVQGRDHAAFVHRARGWASRVARGGGHGLRIFTSEALYR